MGKIRGSRREASRYFKSMDNLAWILREQEKYGDAEELYRRTLREREEFLGKKHADTF
jgi:hypothetical protein